VLRRPIETRLLGMWVSSPAGCGCIPIMAFLRTSPGQEEIRARFCVHRRSVSVVRMLVTALARLRANLWIVRRNARGSYFLGRDFGGIMPATR